jgi:hypothetical protein
MSDRWASADEIASYLASLAPVNDRWAYRRSRNN